MLDKALQLFTTQTAIAVEMSRQANAGFGAIVQASQAFAGAALENHLAFASALTAAKSPEAAAQLQRAYFARSLQTAGEMATQIASAFAAAAAKK